LSARDEGEYAKTQAAFVRLIASSQIRDRRSARPSSESGKVTPRVFEKQLDFRDLLDRQISRLVAL
jgi:hypothetical protein